ncbi:SET domain-containing [Micractinium conductrix]|uniref:SET domain-containing n=1 Tax=Micractinium conductrix TaxID=554055 RepID=A0A2P6V2U4_9CHLO|nr:SET domain-containing [Micractinium conductrix]|eukprot:PSC68405.1 SET domain-containing [Micractinium conductrix]
MRQAEASAAVIDEMMGEISRELFVGAAVAAVTDDGPEPGSTPADVVAAAVGSRLEALDTTFLATLDGYIDGAAQRGASDIAEVLLMVRDQVLRRLAQRLPPEMQLLEAALGAAGGMARMALLRRHAAQSPEKLAAAREAEAGSSGGSGSAAAGGGAGNDAGGEAGDDAGGAGGSGPSYPSLHCLACDLERACGQVIQDMELMPEVPDRRLLAKLVLVREEVQQLLDEAAFMGTAAEDGAGQQMQYRQLGAIPRSCAVLLQRLVALPAQAERRALLEHALQSDTERAPGGGPGPDPTNFERLRAEAEKPQEWVRPGRFMLTLNALQQEMLQQAQGGGSDGGSDSSGGTAAPSGATLERLESVRREALQVRTLLEKPQADIQARRLAQLTTGLGVEVRLDAGDGKGRGVFATQEFEAGDLIFKDPPLAAIQHTANAADAWVCARCFRFIGSVEQQLARRIWALRDAAEAGGEPHRHQEASDGEGSAGDSDAAGQREAAQALDGAAVQAQAAGELRLPCTEGAPLPAPVPCPGGCPDAHYCSETCAEAAWQHSHQLLCPGPPQGEAGGDAAPGGGRGKGKAPAAPPAAAPADAENAAEAAARRHALLELCELADSTNDVFRLAAQVVAATVLAAERRLAEGGCSSCSSGGGGGEPSGDACWAALQAAWEPFAMGHKGVWWECTAVPPEATADMRQLAVDSLELLCDALPARLRCRYPSLLELPVWGSIIGMFELNNLSIFVPSPLHRWLAALEALPDSQRAVAYKAAGPFIATLPDELPGCEGNAFYGLHSCCNHSCAPNAEAFKREGDQDGDAVILALRPVSAGEEITLSYIDEEAPLAERREQLADYGFECGCDKCAAEELAAQLGDLGDPRIARASTTTQQQQQRQWQFRHRRRRRQCRLAGAAAEGEATPLQSEQQQQQTHTPGQPWIATAALRKVTAAGDANEALDVLCAECPALGLLSEAQCLELMLACLDRGNAALALSMFRSMSAAAGGAAASPAASLLSSLDGDAGSSSSAAALRWPPASVATGARLVVGLARVLETRAAIGLINSVRARGLASTEDVCFGHVVGCPQDSSKPLAVVQPQEGVKTVADSFSRYEYELFSGRVASAASESLVSDQNWLLAAARRVGLLKRPAVAAVHTLLVETPAGQQRTFRLGTATADVPAKLGDRITVVCAPQRTSSPLAARRLLGTAPHGTKPEEPLSVSNHTTRGDTPALRAPAAAAAGGLPSWAVPAAVLLAGGDAASALIDPALPLIVAGAVAGTLATGVAGNSLLLPRLKQLPERVLEVPAARQKLLAQHTDLELRINELVEGSVEDVLMLARLWQLQSKMAAVGGEGTYEARLDRVTTARAGLEERLQKRIELVDAYARVIAMIEIEVEMDADLPAAEVLGIEEQILRLSEIEELQAEWTIQAEAQDEVERLLRSTVV